MAAKFVACLEDEHTRLVARLLTIEQRGREATDAAPDHGQIISLAGGFRGSADHLSQVVIAQGVQDAK